MSADGNRICVTADRAVNKHLNVDLRLRTGSALGPICGIFLLRLSADDISACFYWLPSAKNSIQFY